MLSGIGKIVVGMENAFINVKNRSHTITAEVAIPEGGGEGVDEATTVTEDYAERHNESTGKIEKVTVEEQ